MKHRPIGQIIKELTNITDEDLERALQVQRGTREPLGQLLVKMGLITQRDRARALSRQWGIPFIELRDDMIDQDTLNLLPKHLVQHSPDSMDIFISDLHEDRT